MVVSDSPCNLSVIVPPALSECTPTRPGFILLSSRFSADTALLMDMSMSMGVICIHCEIILSNTLQRRLSMVPWLERIWCTCLTTTLTGQCSESMRIDVWYLPLYHFSGWLFLGCMIQQSLVPWVGFFLAKSCFKRNQSVLGRIVLFLWGICFCHWLPRLLVLYTLILWVNSRRQWLLGHQLPFLLDYLFWLLLFDILLVMRLVVQVVELMAGSLV